MENIVRAAIYTRVSSDDALQSRESQFEICKELLKNAARTKGVYLKITHVFKEEVGTSGKDADRVEFQKLLRLIRSGLINWVSAKEVSRFCRNVADFQNFLNECRKYNVSIFIPGMEIDRDNPISEVVPNILAVFAQLEIKLGSSRTKSSIASMIKTESRIPGGCVILGFRRVSEGSWLPLDEEVLNVKKIFNIALVYKTLSAAVLKINELGIVNKTGARFTTTSLKGLLTNRKYIAKLQMTDGPGEVDLPFDPIVDVEIFERVQKMLEDLDKAYKGKNRNSNKVYILTGLLISNNGNSFKGTSSGGFYYYREKNEKLTFDSDSLEMSILKSIRFFCKKNGIEDYKKEVLLTGDEKISVLNLNIAKLVKEIRNIQFLRSNAIDAFLKSTISNPLVVKSIENRLVELDSRAKDLMEEKEKYLEDIKEIEATNIGLDQLESHLSIIPNSEDISQDRASLRGWIRGLVEKIVINTDTKRISIYWNTEVTNGYNLLPFRVELSECSRDMASKKDAGLCLKTLKDLAASRLTSTQIAKQMGVSRSTISKHLALNNIPTFSKGQNQLRKKGVTYGAKPTKKGIDLKITKEQNTIQTILKWKAQDKTFREVATLLNEANIPTKTGTALWTGKTVHQIWIRNKET